MKNMGFIAFCLLIAVANVATAAANLTGKVIAVHDGDTLTLLVANRQVKVRLGEIDTPELAQPYGSKAKTGTQRAGVRQGSTSGGAGY
jgi:endonuclease YncB( thermonuclease family)